YFQHVPSCLTELLRFYLIETFQNSPNFILQSLILLSYSVQMFKHTFNYARYNIKSYDRWYRSATGYVVCLRAVLSLFLLCKHGETQQLIAATLSKLTRRQFDPERRTRRKPTTTVRPREEDPEEANPHRDYSALEGRCCQTHNNVL
ncbi:hypothetical protein L9F63_009243, partial [Diploptera punctata]